LPSRLCAPFTRKLPGRDKGKSDFHTGVPYLEKMFLCVECQLFICESCHEAHEPFHLRQMIRFDIIRWMKKLPRVAPSVTCQYCAKESKARWQCYKCDMALCRTCVGYHDRRKDFFTEHQKLDPDGRSFVAIYPPYWHTNPSWITPVCQCIETNSPYWYHCDRCHKGTSKMSALLYVHC
jgi:hypothetical protein